MSGVNVSVVLVLVLGIRASLQLEDCEISSGRLRGAQRGSPLTASPNCSDGFISWHYPQGSLDVVFPMTTLPAYNDTGRPRMRVCFRGRDLGDSVTSITQNMTTRRDLDVTMEIELSEEDSETSWVCSRPSRPWDNTGVRVVFGSLSDGAPETFKAIIHYKAEEAQCCRHHGGRHGNRRGPNGGRGRGRGRGHNRGRGQSGPRGRYYGRGY